MKIMIRAVCYNRKVFLDETIQRICEETGGHFAGSLVDMSFVNCIESYPDGNFCFSIVRKGQKDIFDCNEDIDMFIYVNTHYGPDKKQEE